MRPASQNRVSSEAMEMKAGCLRDMHIKGFGLIQDQDTRAIRQPGRLLFSVLV
jgi:hypothetical protein